MKTKTIYILMAITCAMLLASASAFASIVLEIHSNTTDGSIIFTDSSKPVRVISPIDDAKHSTAIQAKFGGSSMHFDGAGDYLDIADSDEWDFGTGDFTIDCWFNKAALGVTNWVFGQSNASESDDSFRLSLTSTNKTQFFLTDSGGTRHYIISTNTFSATAWHHFAAVRDNDDLKIFLDGTLESTVDVTDITARNSASKLAIGRWGENDQTYYDGYLDDFYIRKGVAFDQYQITAINDIGNKLNDYLAAGVNTTLGLGYTTQQIGQLADLYAAGDVEVTLVIGGKKWRYFADLPNQGEYILGDAYTYKGLDYVYLGSGIGEVPELPKGAAMRLMMILVIYMKVKRRMKIYYGKKVTT